ncbi:MAG: hypothetical protein KF883_09110 [Thermomicrobiales bacterium]|nr:hypothetical protein [Thermomicrobiales bacterium]
MVSRFPRLAFAFIALSLLAIAIPAGMTVRAQDDDTPADSTAASSESAVGWLQVVAISCEVSAGNPGVSIALSSEWSSGAGCYDGWAAVWLDGVDYGAAAPVLEVQLDAGSHTLMEPNSGASRAFDVYAESWTVAYIVTTTVAAAQEAPVEAAGETPAETTTLSIQTHICDPAIQDTDALLALGGRIARLAECPVVTLPDFYAPDNSVTAGQAWFDLAISDDGDFHAALSGGAFEPSSICESELGVQLSTDPYDNACFSTSSFAIEAPKGSLTLSMTALPDLHRFGYVETGDDIAAAWVVDQTAGIAGADLSASAESAIVHVYLFAPPQVMIVQHLCGGDVPSADALQQMSGFLEKVNACPATTRDAFGFDATVADGWGITHYLSNVAPRTQRFCEADLGFDFNGVNDNACLEMPAYTLVDVARGAVEVYPQLPEGYALGGVEFTPGTNDANTLLSADLANASIALDTTWDGNVILHLFAVPAGQAPAPSATATATATATPVKPTATPSSIPTATPTQPVTNTGGTGTVQLVALYCLGNQNSTTLAALSPGQQAGATLLGGTCFAGDARLQITFAGRSPGAVTQLGRSGVAWVENAPVTSATGLHSVTDAVSGRTATFAIQQGTVTRVILRVEAALGSTSTGAAAESGQPGSGTTGVNPNDLIGMLVTDVLVTDQMNVLDAGESMAGSYDSNSYAVDLLGGLAVDELLSVTTVPGVGNGELASESGRSPWPLAGLAAFAAAFAGVAVRRNAVRLQR